MKCEDIKCKGYGQEEITMLKRQKPFRTLKCSVCITQQSFMESKGYEVL